MAKNASQTALIKFPAPILGKPTAKVKEFGSPLQKIISEMVETMRRVKGVGLAAPQIGLNLRLAVIEFNPSQVLEDKTNLAKKQSPKLPSIPLTILINPKIIWESPQRNQTVEGCLSLPYDEYQLSRSNEIKILVQNTNGQRVRIRAKGLFAQICQHEIDHLDGILIKDRGKKLIKKNNQVKSKEVESL